MTAIHNDIKHNAILIAEEVERGTKTKRAKKLRKELSGKERKIVCDLLYERDVKHDPAALSKLQGKLRMMTAQNYKFERKTHIFKQLFKRYKNDCKDRIDSKSFVNQIHHRPINPLPQEKAAVELLRALCKFITSTTLPGDKKMIFAHEGFFRIPGGVYRRKELQRALYDFCHKEKKVPNAADIKKIASSIEGLNCYDVSSAFKAIVNDLPACAGEKEGINPSAVLKKHKDLEKEIEALFNLILKEPDTKFNTDGLGAAFPAAGYLVKE